MGEFDVTENYELLRKWQNEKCILSRDELVRRYLPLAKKLARILQNDLNPAEDLVQEGMIAFVSILHRVDVQRHGGLSGFAKAHIKGAMLNALRDRGHMIKLPRETYQGGFSPQYLEINATGYVNNSGAISAFVDLPSYSERRSRIPVDESTIDYPDSVDGILALLGEPHKTMMMMREQGYSQRETATFLGCSQFEVSRKLRKALDLLKASLTIPEDEALSGVSIDLKDRVAPTNRSPLQYFKRIVPAKASV